MLNEKEKRAFKTFSFKTGTLSKKRIQTKYKELSLLYHPDTSSGNKDLFLDVQSSYKILIATLKRLKQDNNTLNVSELVQYKSLIGNEENNQLDLEKEMRDNVEEELSPEEIIEEQDNAEKFFKDFVNKNN